MTDEVKEPIEKKETKKAKADGLIAVESSNIKKIGLFDTRGQDASDNEAVVRGTMAVVFKNGTRYHYANVPRRTFKTILQAKSVGKAFNELVKAKTEEFKARKIVDNGADEKKEN